MTKNRFRVSGDWTYSISREAKFTDIELLSKVGMKKVFDYVLVGTGPGSSSWLRSILKRNKNARIAILEKGPFDKTDVLTERNPIKALRASRTMVKEYEHEVMQGNCLGGGTGVNNYAWVTPSENDLNNYAGAEATRHVDLKDFHDLCEDLAYKGPLHPLHNLMTEHAKEKFDLRVRSNYKSRVHEVNRGFIHLGTLNPVTHRHTHTHTHTQNQNRYTHNR